LAAEAGVLRHPCQESNYDSRRRDRFWKDNAGMAFLLPGWVLHIIVGNPGTYLLVHYSLGSQVALNAILVYKQRHASSYEKL